MPIRTRRWAHADVKRDILDNGLTVDARPHVQGVAVVACHAKAASAVALLRFLAGLPFLKPRRVVVVYLVGSVAAVIAVDPVGANGHFWITLLLMILPIWSDTTLARSAFIASRKARTISLMLARMASSKAC